MNIYVLNKQLDIVAVVDAYKSIIWTNRYYECGDFELYLSATPSLIYDLREDYILVREDREDNGMVIENIKITTDVEEGNYLTVSGRCLKSILYRRIIWEQTQVKADIEECISILIDKNIINPVDTNRKIENVKLGNMIATKTELSAQYTGDNLGETITAICQSFGLGWDVSLDMKQKTFTFVLYSGANRSYNQKENTWVVFSSEYDNLLSSEYAFSKQNYGNVTKVAGEGEGLARKYTTVGNASGLDRYEIYTDARDVSTNEGKVTEEEYKEQLAEKGKEQLAETVKTETFSGEVLQYQYTYGKDYFLGDIVEVVNEYEMSAVSRITEVIESEDESGNYTIPTFLTWEGFAIVEPKEERESHLFIPPPQVIEPPGPPQPPNPPETKTEIEVAFTGIEFNEAIKNLMYKHINGTEKKQYYYSKCSVKNILFSDLKNASDVALFKQLEVVQKDGVEYEIAIFTINGDNENVYIHSDADVLILPQNMSYMFCAFEVPTLDLSRFDTSRVVNMANMFDSCTALTSLDLSGFNTDNVTDMQYMFAHCWNITSLNLSTFNTSNVTNMLRMFDSCIALISLDLSGFDTSNVTNMQCMFLDCRAMTSLNLSNFNTSNVTNMSYMFRLCAVKSLDLSSFDTSKVNNMAYMFESCEKLTYIAVSDLFTTSKANVTNMFDDCGTDHVTYI